MGIRQLQYQEALAKIAAGGKPHWDIENLRSMAWMEERSESAKLIETITSSSQGTGADEIAKYNTDDFDSGVIVSSVVNHIETAIESTDTRDSAGGKFDVRHPAFAKELKMLIVGSDLNEDFSSRPVFIRHCAERVLNSPKVKYIDDPEILKIIKKSLDGYLLLSGQTSREPSVESASRTGSYAYSAEDGRHEINMQEVFGSDQERVEAMVEQCIDYIEFCIKPLAEDGSYIWSDAKSKEFAATLREMVWQLDPIRTRPDLGLRVCKELLARREVTADNEIYKRINEIISVVDIDVLASVLQKAKGANS